MLDDFVGFVVDVVEALHDAVGWYATIVAVIQVNIHRTQLLHHN